MRRLFILFLIVSAFAENNIDLSFYTSTKGEMQVDFISQWNVLKLDAALAPMGAGLSGDAIFTAFPFLLLRGGAMVGMGWNYEMFGQMSLIGLGLNKKENADDPNDGVIGKGFDGVVWNAHAGATLQFDLAAIFPGDWNHVVMQFYNRVEYFAYTKAKGDDLWYWYYYGDDGMNINAFLHKYEFFIGYQMPIFVDLIGYQLRGVLPFYNVKAGGNIREQGYFLNNAFIVDFKINERFSIITLTNINNKFKEPITSEYEREWKFDRVQVIATWRLN